MKGELPPEPYERRPAQPELAAELMVQPWVDAVVEEHGFGPRSMYVEVCWLPVLGPSATWLYRRLGSWAEYNPDGLSVDLTDLSVSLGLGEGLGRHSLLAKAFGRLARFEAARWQGDHLAVRRALAPLPERRAAQLSYTAFRLHQELTGRGPTPTVATTPEAPE